MLYFADKFINFEIVIRKGGGIRPFEALATLYFLKKVLNSTCFGQITRVNLSSLVFGNNF
jgi:hypothetical protein